MAFCLTAVAEVAPDAGSQQRGPGAVLYLKMRRFSTSLERYALMQMHAPVAPPDVAQQREVDLGLCLRVACAVSGWGVNGWQGQWSYERAGRSWGSGAWSSFSLCPYSLLCSDLHRGHRGHLPSDDRIPCRTHCC